MRIIRFYGLGAFLTVLIADIGTKNAILEWFLSGGDKVTVNPYFNLILTWNKGVSFGFLAAGSLAAKWSLIALALALSFLIGTWLWRAASKLEAFCYGMIIGGAIGNVYDRILHGAVVDFIDFHAFGYHWYTFNIADCGITIGAIILVLQQFFANNKVKQ